MEKYEETCTVISDDNKMSLYPSINFYMVEAADMEEIKLFGSHEELICTFQKDAIKELFTSKRERLINLTHVVSVDIKGNMSLVDVHSNKHEAIITEYFSSNYKRPLLNCKGMCILLMHMEWPNKTRHARIMALNFQGYKEEITIDNISCSSLSVKYNCTILKDTFWLEL